MGICCSSSKSKSGDGLWDGKNDSRRSDSKLKKNSYSGDFSTFFSKLSGVGGGGAEEKGLHRIPGRLLGNGATSRACLHTQQGKKGTNQDTMIVWEVLNFHSVSIVNLCLSVFWFVFVLNASYVMSDQIINLFVAYRSLHI